jgi:FKBP-type peptidyl-prolyl cis-trans isomerase
MPEDLSVKTLTKISLCLCAFVLFPLTTVRAQREKFSQEDVEYIEKTWPTAKKTNTGLRYIIEKAGTGETPKPGDSVSVLYVGRLLNGEIFDQNNDKDHPFIFRVARDMVIQGWDQIIQQMRLGEKLLVVIPPELAYGTRGQAPRIPRSTSLVFTMELIEIKHD